MLKKWYTKLNNEQNYQKRVFKIIHNARKRISVQLQHSGVDQSAIITGADPLDVRGVIYAVVHLPTSKIYVGQTINSAFDRLKSHWYARLQSDYRNGLLRDFMRNQPLHNFVVWPLEIIDKTMYVNNGISNTHLFRNTAVVRETFWIKELRCLQHWGFNAYLPVSNNKHVRRGNKESFRHSRFTANPNMCAHCYDFLDGKITVHMHDGPQLKLRKGIQYWLNFFTSTNRRNTLQSKISASPREHRVSVLKWISQHVTAMHQTEDMLELGSMIRSSLSPADESGNDVNPRPPPKQFIKIVHAYESINYARIREVLRLPRSLELLQLSDKPDLVPMICDKQLNPISRQLCNFTREVTDKLAESDIALPHEPLQCPCRIFFPACTDLVKGHVMTANYEWINDPTMHQLFGYGLKYRLNETSEEVMLAISLGLDTYIQELVSKLPRGSPERSELMDRLQTWKLFVLDTCKGNFNRHQHQVKQQIKNLNSHKKTIRDLKKSFVIAPVDKSSHNFAVTCKRLYRSMVATELYSPVFKRTDESKAEILLRHEEFNRRKNLQHKDALPYLYGLPKMHKTPPKLRFISGVASSKLPNRQQDDLTEVEQRHMQSRNKPHCSTTAASKEVTIQLQRIMDVLKAKDNKLFIAKGYRRYWIVNDMDEVFLDMKKNRDLLQGKKPRTFDFTTMYTCLPHQTILTNVRKAICEAKEYSRQRFMENETRNTDALEDISTDDLMDLVTFIVSNSYICNNPDEGVFQQDIGIPMGTNSAPAIANLTLYITEAEYIDSIIRDGHDDIAKHHAFTFRLIDDLRCFDIEPPSGTLYGLEWSETTAPDGSVTFLGSKIQPRANGSFEVSVFDKQKEWNFPVIKYPHFSSNVPEHQAVGIVKGQLYRFRTICNSIKAFKDAVQSFALQLLQREYPFQIIHKGWKAHLARFSHDKITDYPRLQSWFRRMIYYLMSVLGKRLVRKDNREYIQHAQPGHSLQPFHQPTMTAANVSRQRQGSGIISNPHPRQPSSAAARALFRRQPSNQLPPPPSSSYADVTRDGLPMPPNGTPPPQSPQSRFQSPTGTSTGTSQRSRDNSSSSRSQMTSVTVQSSGRPFRSRLFNSPGSTVNTPSPGRPYRSRLFNSPVAPTQSINSQAASSVTSTRYSSTPNTHATPALVISSDDDITNSSYTLVAPRRTRSGKTLNNRLSTMQYCQSVLNMGTVSLEQIATQPRHNQSTEVSNSHHATPNPHSSTMPPPIATQNRFSILNSDIENEVEPETDDNIDEPCASQEEPVLCKLRSFKQFIIDSGTDQIRDKYLAETSHLIHYLKQKEQRASKSNSRLLDLNCSKCGQLFSSAIGLKKHLSSAGDNMCQRVIQTLQKRDTFMRQHSRDTQRVRRSTPSPSTGAPLPTSSS